MNRVLRLIVIGFLIFRLTPIGGETAEVLIEIVAHSDEPHEDVPDAEHGCTALMHHCGCHSAVGSFGDASISLAPPRRLVLADFVLSRPQVEPDVRALLRPPAA